MTKALPLAVRRRPHAPPQSSYAIPEVWRKDPPGCGSDRKLESFSDSESFGKHFCHRNDGATTTTTTTTKKGARGRSGHNRPSHRWSSVADPGMQHPCSDVGDGGLSSAGLFIGGNQPGQSTNRHGQKRNFSFERNEAISQCHGFWLPMKPSSRVRSSRLRMKSRLLRAPC